MRRQILIALGVVIVVVACDNSPGTPPSLPPPPPANPTVKAMTINGRNRIAPGEKESYEAIAQLTDGSTQIYTTKAQWRSSAYYVLSMTKDGQASALGVGESTITAAFGNIQSSLNVMIVPAGTYRLAGKVLETGLPVIDAAVRVTSGQGPAFQVSTDVLGQYRVYGVAGPVEVKVTKAGYAPLTKTISVATDELLDFPELAQTGAIGTYGGAYTLTLTMSPRCVSDFTRFHPLPADASTRTYSAVMTQDGPRLSVSLSGGNFSLKSGRGNQFDGHIEPTGISFKLGSLGGYAYDYYYYHPGVPDVADRLSTGEYLSYLATARTTATPGGFSGPLDGIAMVFSPGADGAPSASLPRSMCWAGDHQFSLTPQTAATRIRR